MPYQGDVFAAGQFYHIYNRSLGPLFLSEQDYQSCLHLIERHHTAYGASIIAYCLMPNHYHLLLRQDGDLPLSRFINVLFNAYVQAFNLRHSRRGPLFEGRFRHVWVDREEYLLHLCRYIHLNPVMAGLAANPDDWPHSDYLDWTGKRAGPLPDRAFIQEHFGTGEDYRQFVANYRDEARNRRSIERYAWD